MPEFPQELLVGSSDNPTKYELLEDQVLIAVNDEGEFEAFSEISESNAFESADTPEHIRRARLTLEPAGLRWVTLTDDSGGFSNAREQLAENDDVVEMRPIYQKVGGGIETAASPIANTLLIEIDAEKLDNIREALSEMDIAYNENASRALEPVHVFTLNQENPEVADAARIISEIEELDGVTTVDFDWFKLETYMAAPNDTLFTNQWNMTIISADDAWDVEMGDPDVWVAIIDSGFDLTHPDLKFTPNTAANPTHCNADDFIAGDPTPYDAGSSGVFHGTACAGIAAASIDNSRGVAGVAGNCCIMPVRLGSVPTSARVAAGLNWARQNGASVASLSLSTTATVATNNAVMNAWNAGMVICAATGNSGNNTSSPAIGYPASHANVIAVGASDQNDERKRPASGDGECWGSQYDDDIDVVAPGVRIWTTDEQGASGYNNNSGGSINWACVNYASSGDAVGDYVAVFNGTSAATPHVAGLATLIRSANPSLTNQEVRDIIESTCDKISPGLYTYAVTAGRPNGTWHEEVGYGRINASAAICAAIESVTLQTPSVVFNNVPAGEMAIRAITFEVHSCQSIDLQITAGPIVVSGPGTTSYLPFLGVTSTTILPSATPQVTQLWIAFTGTATGDIANGTVTVDCPQTGESWVIPISSNTIQPKAAAVVMVLDQSGSMNSDAGDGRKRIDVLRDAAPVFPSLLHGNDSIGVVAFDHDAYDRLPITDVSAGGKIAANSIIGAHTPNPSGLTSIGDGVARAQTHLSGVSTTDFPTHATVVLTDGRENSPLSLADVAGSINSQVFAIGLGTPEQINPTALNQLTNGHDGYVLMTGELDQNEYFTLQKYYLQILSGVTNSAIVLDPDGFVQLGNLVEIPFNLAIVDYGVDIILLTPAPYAVKFSLITPQGDLIEPADATGLGGEYVQDNKHSYYRFNLPVPISGGTHHGRWRALLEVDDKLFRRYIAQLEETENEAEIEIALAHGIRYSLNVHTRSNLHLRAHAYQETVQVGSEAFIEANLIEYSQPVENRASVVAEITQPDKSTFTIELKEVSKGSFHGSFKMFKQGVYRCRLLATGKTFHGHRFSREHLLTTATWDPNELSPDEDRPYDDKPTKACSRQILQFAKYILHNDRLSAYLIDDLPNHDLDYETVIKQMMTANTNRIPIGIRHWIVERNSVLARFARYLDDNGELAHYLTIQLEQYNMDFAKVLECLYSLSQDHRIIEHYKPTLINDSLIVKTPILDRLAKIRKQFR